MVCKRAALFPGRHFTDEIIVLCVRRYLRYSLSYRGLTEMMCERNLSVDPSTIWRWVQRYAPELNERVRRQLKPTNCSWRTDETYVCVAGPGPLYIYIEPWIQQAQRLTSCFPRLAI
jgi:transposase-like protein